MYFEDEGYEEFYLRLVRIMLPDLDLRDVFSLGGKGNLKARIGERSPNGKPRVFIIDMDFGDLLGFPMEHDQTVYLHRYSIENYLLDLPALTQLALEHKRGARLALIETVLGIDLYFTQLLESYDPLARLFVIIQKNELNLKSTKQEHAVFADPQTGLVKEDFVEKLRNKLVEQASKRGLEIKSPDPLDAALAAALEPQPRFAEHADPVPHAHFCGKHLLRMMLDFIDSKLDTDLGQSELFEIGMRLLTKLPASTFDRLKAAIETSLDHQGYEGT
jgi:hypothetical protein